MSTIVAAHVGRVFSSVCLSVYLSVCLSVCLSVWFSARYLKNRCSYDWSPNLKKKCSTIHYGNPFILGPKYQRARWQSTTTVPAWAFALLWVLASCNWWQCYPLKAEITFAWLAEVNKCLLFEFYEKTWSKSGALNTISKFPDDSIRIRETGRVWLILDDPGEAAGWLTALTNLSSLNAIVNSSHHRLFADWLGLSV